MTEEKPPSPLLALPRELRDLIYEYTFTASVHIKDNDIGDHNAGLLSACHQTRAEAAKLYYQRTIFQATGRDRQDVEGNLARFFHSVSPQSLRLIRAIFVSVRDLEDDLFSDDYDLGAHGIQRLEYSRICLSLGLRFQWRIPAMRTILKVKVLSWNGEENEEIWTSNPYSEELPRL